MSAHTHNTPLDPDKLSPETVRVLEAVIASGPITVAALRATTRMSKGTLFYHVSRLEASNWIASTGGQRSVAPAKWQATEQGTSALDRWKMAANEDREFKTEKSLNPSSVGPRTLAALDALRQPITAPELAVLLRITDQSARNAFRHLSAHGLVRSMGFHDRNAIKQITEKGRQLIIDAIAAQRHKMTRPVHEGPSALITTLLNAPADAPTPARRTSVWELPVYVPPKVEPTRPGAMDAMRIKSRGV